MIRLLGWFLLGSGLAWLLCASVLGNRLTNYLIGAGLLFTGSLLVTLARRRR